MGSLSLPHLIILGAIALIFFGGRNKISDIMGDFAKGIKSFKKGLSDDDEKPVAARPVSAGDVPVHTLDHQPLASSELNKVSEARKVG
jgi:sec-independent protein translocase protein TatA